ncbi:murein biosynthesis integral membrane protein MurJ [Streptomyces sp. NP160]|uniref:murein biosynthesis integral membrane protein MurJ n=1 Tax=Streptomyces sp. NP160 TaxID=2586637 RepID=UPI001C55D074|nr:murein biosynthesis integral membrane protein MurJ [Streptomyces sp. NP160]
MAEARPERRSLTGAALGRASAVMAAGTAVSRVLGFVRVSLLAAVISAVGAGANAFTVANTVPNMLYLLIAGGVLNAVLVPQVVRAMQRPDGGAEYLDRLVTAAVVALAAVTAVLVAAAPLVILLTTFRADPAQRSLAVAFGFWCLPQVFFYALYTLLGQILNAKGRFGAYMWAPVVNNVVGVAGLGVFILAFGAVGKDVPAGAWTPAQIAVLAGSSTLGVVAQALVLLPVLRRAGVRLRPRWGVRGMGLRSAGRVAGWTFGALLLSQGSAFVIANVGSSVGGGESAGNTVWSSAFLVFMLPHSLVTVSLVTALFTRMSRAAAEGDLNSLRTDVSSGLRTVAVATVVASAGLVALNGPTGVLLAGGRPDDGAVLARVIAVVALGLVPFSATYLVQRGFYALEDAKTPFFVQALTTALWVSVSLATFTLPADVRIEGVAAGLVLSQWVGALVGVLALRRRLGGVDGARLVRTHAKLLLLGALAAVAGLAVVLPLDGLLRQGYLGAAVLAVVGGVVVVLVYAVGLRVLHVEEVRPLLRRLPGPLGRR